VKSHTGRDETACAIFTKACTQIPTSHRSWTQQKEEHRSRKLQKISTTTLKDCTTIKKEHSREFHYWVLCGTKEFATFIPPVSGILLDSDSNILLNRV
jgi:hypothetical protein